MSEAEGFSPTPEQMQEDAFRPKLSWPEAPDLALDERAPLGFSAGPNAARRIGAAVANGPTSSRQSWLRKVNQSPGALRPEVRGARPSATTGIACASAASK